MKLVINILLLAVMFASCDEPIRLDLKQTPPKIVIEGMVTDKPGLQRVKVSRSSDFYSSGQTPRIADALVQVFDDAGEEFDFVHNPGNHPDSLGIYVPQSDFAAQIGRTYTLRVSVDGEVLDPPAWHGEPDWFRTRRGAH